MPYTDSANKQVASLRISDFSMQLSLVWHIASVSSSGVSVNTSNHDCSEKASSDDDNSIYITHFAVLKNTQSLSEADSDSFNYASEAVILAHISRTHERSPNISLQTVVKPKIILCII